MAKQSRRPTLRTVAEHVGLSPSTVSLALRGDRSIPLETRQRVLAAAKELNYTYVPRSRKQKKPQRRIAYVAKDYGDSLPITGNPFYGRILNGVQQACQAHNIELVAVPLEHILTAKSELPDSLCHTLDGALLATPYPAATVERITDECRCPVLLIDNVLDLPFDSVMAEDFGGAYRVTRHLLELGHRQIMMLTGRTKNVIIPPSYKERYRGYSTACTDAGIAPLPPAVLPPPADEFNEDGQQALQEWLASFLEQTRPTAFFGAGDNYALNTMTSLQNLGWRIPHDFSVVGFDDYFLASLIHPPLTTVHVYTRRIGQVAVDRLLKRIEGDDGPKLHIAVETRLVVRDSTGPPPKS